MSSVETKTIGSVESVGTENILIFLTKFGSFKEDTIKVYFFFFESMRPKYVMQSSPK